MVPSLQISKVQQPTHVEQFSFMKYALKKLTHVNLLCTEGA